MDAEQPKTAVVIGGGYIGLEMAEALIMRGLDVSLVDRGVQVMNTLDPDMGSLVSDALIEAGVKLYREEALEAFEVADGRVKAVVTNKRSLPADMVILGLGVQPRDGSCGPGGNSTRRAGGHPGERLHDDGGRGRFGRPATAPSPFLS